MECDIQEKLNGLVSVLDEAIDVIKDLNARAAVLIEDMGDLERELLDDD